MPPRSTLVPSRRSSDLRGGDGLRGRVFGQADGQGESGRDRAGGSRGQDRGQPDRGDPDTHARRDLDGPVRLHDGQRDPAAANRSEEHTSELQSPVHRVCPRGLPSFPHAALPICVAVMACAAECSVRPTARASPAVIAPAVAAARTGASLTAAIQTPMLGAISTGPCGCTTASVIPQPPIDRKSTRLNSSHPSTAYAPAVYPRSLTPLFRSAWR